MHSVTKLLEEKLDLKVNVTKSKVDRSNGIKYLWFYFDIFSHQVKAKLYQISVKKLKENFK